MTRLETRIPLVDAPTPGDVRMVWLGRHRVGLFCVGDQLYALADRCPHRGAPLCSSGRTVRGIALRDGIPAQGSQPSLLRCPWHKWDFDITTGECLVHPRLRARSYQVVIDQDEIVITASHPIPDRVVQSPPSRRRRLREASAYPERHDGRS